MNPRERRASLSLAAIYMLRMLGFFMILPVFALYAQDELVGSTALLVGVALGIYGLTQAALQVPFGLLSDRIGRKPVIAFGLLIFAAGSVVAAMSDHIVGVILGRSLQGAGAIAAALMALTADLTREQHRTKAMAVIGMSIGLSFALSLLLAPLLDHWLGVRGIFWLTAGLALTGLLVLFLLVPTPERSSVHRDAELVPALFSSVIRDPQLLRLDAGIFVLHMLITATFLVVPQLLQDVLGLPVASHWQVYLAVLVLSVAGMVPAIIIGEKKQQVRGFFLAAVSLLVVSLTALALFHEHGPVLLVMFYLFFLGFNYLEATLPSLVSRLAPADRKGTALGVYSSSQFMGSFVGGALGGWIMGHFGSRGIFSLMALMAAIWLVLAWGMQNPRSVSNLIINIPAINGGQADALRQAVAQVPGVAEVAVHPEEQKAYLKVEKKRLDQNALQAVLSSYS
jgi:predicted MFS family arabinose efflux permease